MRVIEYGSYYMWHIFSYFQQTNLTRMSGDRIATVLFYVSILRSSIYI